MGQISLATASTWLSLLIISALIAGAIAPRGLLPSFDEFEAASAGSGTAVAGAVVAAAAAATAFMTAKTLPDGVPSRAHLSATGSRSDKDGDRVASPPKAAVSSSEDDDDDDEDDEAGGSGVCGEAEDDDVDDDDEEDALPQWAATDAWRWRQPSQKLWTKAQFPEGIGGATAEQIKPSHQLIYLAFT